MSTPGFIGHPDFIPTSSTPVPVLLEDMGSFGVGSFSVGPFIVTGGGAYAISVINATSSDFTATDITVKHFDVAENLVATDFFGAVLAGNTLTGIPFLNGPTVVRGNIYGASMTISGDVAAATWLNTITGLSGLTASPAKLRLYIFPNSLADPEPRISNGTAANTSTGNAIPGTILAQANGLSLGPGVTSAINVLVPYQGPAVFSLRESGVTTTPTNLRAEINHYTVINGTSPCAQQLFAATANIVSLIASINLPSCLSAITWFNTDGAQTCTVVSTIIADKTA